MSDSVKSDEFRFPTSGQILGEVVSAFRLHLDTVGGPCAQFLGSGNAGKRSRDYFEGKWVPDETRLQICTYVAEAAIHSTLLPDLRSSDDDANNSPGFKNWFARVLHNWLGHWDLAYAAAAGRWPNADPGLAGVAVGRQVVIDLSLRLVGLVELLGQSDPEAFTIEDGRSGKGKPILDRLMKFAGKTLTRDQITTELGRTAAGQVNERTVDRWFDELVIPDDENLVALTKAIGRDAESAKGLLRSARLHYGVVRLAKRLRDAMGEQLSNRLFHGLQTFVRQGVWIINQAPASLGIDVAAAIPWAPVFNDIIEFGSKSKAAGLWLKGWQMQKPDSFWLHDLQYAASNRSDERVIACFQVAGNAQRLIEVTKAQFDSRGAIKSLTPEDFRNVAIQLMNDDDLPTKLKQFIAEKVSTSQQTESGGNAAAAFQSEKGMDARNRGDHDGALPHLAAAVRLEANPRFKSNYLFFYGCSLWQARARRYGDAIEALRESFWLWPDTEPKRDYPFVEIATVYINRGWFGHALQHLETDPAGFSETSGRFNLVKGQAHYLEHQWADALACFEKAIQLRHALGESYDRAAECLFQLNKLKPDRATAAKAKDYAKKALHLGFRTTHDKWNVG